MLLALGVLLVEGAPMGAHRGSLALSNRTAGQVLRWRWLYGINRGVAAHVLDDVALAFSLVPDVGQDFRRQFGSVDVDEAENDRGVLQPMLGMVDIQRAVHWHAVGFLVETYRGVDGCWLAAKQFSEEAFFGVGHGSVP